MTIEEAIKRLEFCFDCIGCFTCGSHDNAMRVVLDALREQEERSKGCDFCNERNVAVMSASILTFDLKHHGCMCRFCPMCGRKLEVEG